MESLLCSRGVLGVVYSRKQREQVSAVTKYTNGDNVKKDKKREAGNGYRLWSR